ncbi:MAG TPA: ATP-binding cassette domain-containing protein [Candidatus Omnitrophota bacterium]|nr:ATP-binding cassette domain-containing protein [Candidatus Omnitrophota bacterium]
MDNELITAKDLIKKFGDLAAVDGISFTIEPGLCFGFLGPNGAGKTTTIRMMHCVSPVTSGTLTVFGHPANVDDRKIKAMTGVIPQDNYLDADLTVRENLLLFADVFNIKKAEADARIAELLKFVELEPKADRQINELSGGMKRRLSIAKALINQPRLIIADEPTTGLDPQARHMIWQRLRQVKRQGATMVLTTQYMEEAEQLCDRVAIMNEGKILKEGRPSDLIVELIGNEVVEIQIAAEEDKKILGHLAGIACEHERVGDMLFLYCRDGRSVMQKIMELQLPRVIHRPASLEDVFLKLTGRNLIE